MKMIKVLALVLVCGMFGCDTASNLVGPEMLSAIDDNCSPEINLAIENDKYIATYQVDKLCADDIVGTRNRPKARFAVDFETTLDAIVISTFNNNETYEGNIVRLPAKVKYVLRKGVEHPTLRFVPSFNFLSLDTSEVPKESWRDPALFSVFPPSQTGVFKKKYEEGKTYTFVLVIVEQDWVKDNIRSTIIE